MSLSALALRIAAIEALRGATLAGDAVVDTMGDLGDSEVDLPRFSIAVETGTVAGRTVTVSLTLSVMARSLVETQQGLVRIWQVPPSSRAVERALDVLAHQVEAALLGSLSDWSCVFVGLCGETGKTVRQQHTDGSASRLLALEVTTPAFGANEKAWRLFSAELGAAQGLDAERALFKALAAGAVVPIEILGLDCGLTASEAAEIIAASVAPVEPVVAPAPRKGRGRRK